jgi:hypothetical protein
MQHPNLSSIVISNRYFFMGALALGLTCLADGAEGVTLTLRTDRPELVMGEPLLVELTALNSSSQEVLIRTDGKASSRILIAADGTQTALVFPPVLTEFYSNDLILVGSKKTLRFLVPEIAEVKRAGEYRLIVEYEDLHASGELQFAIKPYDKESLRARAAELYRAATTGAEFGFGPNALVTVDPAIAEPFLCDLMKLNRWGTSPILRLEEIGDEESVRCLIDSYPATKADDREILTGTLIRLLRRLPDGATKDNVKKALRQQP